MSALSEVKRRWAVYYDQRFPRQTWSGAYEVGMPAKSDPRVQLADYDYSYRGSVKARAILPAAGVGIAAGLAAFYLARLYLERTPLIRGREQRVAARHRVQATRTREG